MRKKIIAFAGSNSSQSINRSLIAKTLKSFAEFDVEFLDINDFDRRAAFLSKRINSENR